MKRSKSDTKFTPNKKAKHQKKETILIYLPIEILEQILDKLPFSEYGRIRGTCLQFRNAADNILIRKLMNNNLRTVDTVSLNIELIHSKIYYFLSCPYIQHGYRSSVAGVYLYLINRCARSSEELPLLLSDLINQFFQCIDCQLRNPNTKLSRLLYLVTCLGFLNKLTNIERNEKQINSKKYKINYIVKRPYCTLLCRRSNWNTLIYPDDRNSVILFLAEIMKSNIIRSSLRSTSDVVFGNEVVNRGGRNNKELAIFEFTINGNNKLLKFLTAAPGARDWNDLPTGKFTVTIHITCRIPYSTYCKKQFSFTI